MIQISNTKHITLLTGIVAGLFFALGMSHHAEANVNTFCKDLPQIQEDILSKKQAVLEKLGALQTAHSASFGIDKERIAMLRASYEARKVTPDFTESKKREHIQGVELREENRQKAAAYFATHKESMEQALATVNAMETAAFEKAYSACAHGVDAASAKASLKTDLAMIQTTIRERGTTLEAEKEKVLDTLETDEHMPHRTLRNFFFPSKASSNASANSQAR